MDTNVKSKTTEAVTGGERTRLWRRRTKERRPDGRHSEGRHGPGSRGLREDTGEGEGRYGKGDEDGRRAGAVQPGQLRGVREVRPDLGGRRSGHRQAGGGHGSGLVRGERFPPSGR